MATTGLDFCQDLPSPRLPAIKIPAPATAAATQPPLDNKEGQECRTPTSKEHKIPTILTCPPAPRKPARRVAASCKRKLQFFEITNREEVEDLFRSSFSMINSSRAKRSCPCT